MPITFKKERGFLLIMRETTSAGGVVVNQHGQVLVVSQRGTSWSLPKGHVEEGETKNQAARREIYEESGVRELSFVKELGTIQRFRLGRDGKEDQSEFKTISIFHFTTTQLELQPIDEANPEARWVDKDRVAELLTHPKDKEFFTNIIKEIE